MPRQNRLYLATSIVLALAIVGVGWFIYQELGKPAPVVLPPVATTTEPIAPVVIEIENPVVIGQSVEGRDITAYTYGSGATDLLFVGGIHGGYEWNGALLAYEMIDYFASDETRVPSNISVHIIPALNPDGLAAVVGTSTRFALRDVPDPTTRVAAGRFNANAVDLNRNFDCNWAPESTWRGQPVSAGTAPFSEPEAAVFRDYVLELQPAGVAFWHSQANNVYGSACNNGVLPLTEILGERYATAANYGWVRLFDAYPITGDVEGWLATVGIPAVTVELEGSAASEYTRNLAGVQSWLNYFAQSTQ